MIWFVYAAGVIFIVGFTFIFWTTPPKVIDRVDILESFKEDPKRWISHYRKRIDRRNTILFAVTLIIGVIVMVLLYVFIRAND